MGNIVEKDISSAINMDLLIYMDHSGDSKLWKTMHFNPAKSLYRVKFIDENCVTSYSCTDKLEAIEKYNSYEL